MGEEAAKTKKWFLTAMVLAVSAALYILLPPEQIRAMLSGLGNWAPWAYMAMFAVLPAFFFPVAVLALAGGVAFGLWQGALYTFIGAVVNCSLMFWMARYLGRERVAALLEKAAEPPMAGQAFPIGGEERLCLSYRPAVDPGGAL